MGRFLREDRMNAPPRDPDLQPRLPRNVITLGWVSFFSDVSSEMAYPLLPLFVTGVLGAGAQALGWAEGVATALVAVLTGFAGWQSDGRRSGQVRRVPWIRWGYGLPVIGKLIVASAVAWPMVLVGRAIDRIGKGLRGSPRDALIADSTDPGQRGRAFGFHRAMDTAGAFVGVLATAALLAAFGAGSGSSKVGITPILYIAAAMALASVVCTLFVREVPPVPGDGATPPVSKDTRADAQTVSLNSSSPSLGVAYWTGMAPVVIFALANSSDTFVLLRASQAGLSPMQVVLSYALFNLVYTLCSYPAGVLSDRIGYRRTLSLGWGVYALCYMGFALTSAAGIWALMALYGVYAALTEGVAKALIAELAPPGRRGAALGIFNMSVGLAMLAASVIAGVLWDHISHSAPFWFGAGVSVMAMLAMPLSRTIGSRRTS